MSARVVKRKIKGASSDEMSDMFNQMLGTGSVSMETAYPRYLHLRELTADILKLLETMANTPFVRANCHGEFETFLTDAREQERRYFQYDLTDFEWDFASMDKALYERFSANYLEMKKSQLINSFVIICDQIIPFRKQLEACSTADPSRMDAGFVANMPGVDWCPLMFSRLNFKTVCAEAGFTRAFFILALWKLLGWTKSIYDEITSPDVDVEKFAEIIIQNMDELRHQPGVSRCDKAFAKIRASIGLLKGNFTNYYRDFLEAGDSTIIMQHFITDVTKSTEADVETIRQFRTIIRYYQKMAAQKVTNPRMKAMFDRANECFRQMEERAPNIARSKSDSESAKPESDEPTK